MLHTFAVYVEDKPGVLNRVASLFRRRAFNIDSLTVGHTETQGVSRMTIVCDADQAAARRIEANIYKLVDVLRVDDMSAAAVGRARAGDGQGQRRRTRRARRSSSSPTSSAPAWSTSPRTR